MEVEEHHLHQPQGLLEVLITCLPTEAWVTVEGHPREVEELQLLLLEDEVLQV